MERVVGELAADVAGADPVTDAETEPGADAETDPEAGAETDVPGWVAALLRPKAPMAIGVATAATATTPAAVTAS